MPYNSVDDMRNDIEKKINNYCNDYLFFRPKHRRLAQSFLNKQSCSNTKDDLLDKLYELYVTLIKKRSDKLLRAVAGVLAKELNVSTEKINPFLGNLDQMRTEGFIPTSYYFQGNSLVCYSDPIEIAYNQRRNITTRDNYEKTDDQEMNTHSSQKAEDSPQIPQYQEEEKTFFWKWGGK